MLARSPRYKKRLLKGILYLLFDIHKSTIDYPSFRSVYYDQFSLLGVVFVLDNQIDIGLLPINYALAQFADCDLRTRLLRMPLLCEITHKRCSRSHMINSYYSPIK